MCVRSVWQSGNFKRRGSAYVFFRAKEGRLGILPQRSEMGRPGAEEASLNSHHRRAVRRAPPGHCPKRMHHHHLSHQRPPGGVVVCLRCFFDTAAARRRNGRESSSRCRSLSARRSLCTPAPASRSRARIARCCARVFRARRARRRCRGSRPCGGRSVSFLPSGGVRRAMMICHLLHPSPRMRRAAIIIARVAGREPSRRGARSVGGPFERFE